MGLTQNLKIGPANQVIAKKQLVAVKTSKKVLRGREIVLRGAAQENCFLCAAAFRNMW
jgi:hypothetical protein